MSNSTEKDKVKRSKTAPSEAGEKRPDRERRTHRTKSGTRSLDGTDVNNKKLPRKSRRPGTKSDATRSSVRSESPSHQRVKLAIEGSSKRGLPPSNHSGDTLMRAKSNFDVDIPREYKPVSKTAMCDDATLVSLNEGLTDEQRAWKGIEAVLDDNESIASHDVLPAEILKALSDSYTITSDYVQKSKSKTFDPPLSNQLTGGNAREEDDDEDSHDIGMKKLCGYQGGENKHDMPTLMNASFSSLMSEMTEGTSMSMQSYLTKKNVIIQESSGEEVLKGFLGGIADALEQQHENEPEEQPKEGVRGIFAWSNHGKQEETAFQESRAQRWLAEVTSLRYRQSTTLPKHVSLTSEQQYGPKKIHQKPADSSYDEADIYDEIVNQRTEVNLGTERGFVPQDDLNSSMPSLATMRESDVIAQVNEMAAKWASFGDLNFDATQIKEEPEDWDVIGMMGVSDPVETDTPKRKKMKKKKSEKNPSSENRAKDAKKKRKKSKKEETCASLEALNDFYPKFEPNFTQIPEERSCSSPVKRKSSKVLSDGGLLSPVLKSSARGIMTTPRNARNRFKDIGKSPMKSLRNRIPKISIFGKGRRGSPASVIDTGSREAQFYPDSDGEDDWGGLLLSS